MCTYGEGRGCYEILESNILEGLELKRGEANVTFKVYFASRVSNVKKTRAIMKCEGVNS